MKREWVTIARRAENHGLLLIDSVIDFFLKNSLGKSFGPGVRFVPRGYRQFAGARWLTREDTERYEALLKDAFEKGRLVASGLEYEQRVKGSRAFADSIKGKDFSKRSWPELRSDFRAFFNASGNHWRDPYHYVLLNNLLPGIILAEIAAREPDVSRQNELLLALAESDKPTETREENIALVALAEKLHKRGIALSSPEARRLIEAHLVKYAHLGRCYFRSSPYSVEAIVERLGHLTPKEVKRKKKLYAEQERAPGKSREILARLGLSRRAAEAVAVLKQFSFVSNYSDECYDYFVHHSAPLLKEICRRLDCSWNELVSMRGCEAISALERQAPLEAGFKAELRERFKDHALVLEDGTVRVLVGKELEEYYAQELDEEEDFHHVAELKGVGASPGTARGRVALVFASSDLGKVRKGDVLVTHMTTPEFVPAMQRASAIVTDDGGILCHAAIVSRELHIPCVVGTKLATKALREGDEVEVDAALGVVKKLSSP